MHDFMLRHLPEHEQIIETPRLALFHVIQILFQWVLCLGTRKFLSMYTSGGWKIQKMVKKSWPSVKKMCI